MLKVEIFLLLYFWAIWLFYVWDTYHDQFFLIFFKFLDMYSTVSLFFIIIILYIYICYYLFL